MGNGIFCKGYIKDTDVVPSSSSRLYSLSLRHLGLDLVPRKEFEMVDEEQISVSDLYKMVSNGQLPLILFRESHKLSYRHH